MTQNRSNPNDWNEQTVRRLRDHLGLTQQQLADEIGVRQQTVSEWETGIYAPRGASSKLLRIVADRAEFKYSTKPPPDA